MYATADIIKQEIYDRIDAIRDEKVLKAIRTIIDNLEGNLVDSVTEKEDFSGYIKEWVKNM